MRCAKCQADVVDDARFCHVCGVELGARADGVRTHPERFAAAVHTMGRGPDAEEVIWRGRFSKLAMVGAWIGALAATLVAPLVAWLLQFDRRGWWITLGVLAVLWAVLALRLIYQQLSVHYTLTNQRLIHEWGILWKRIDRIEIIDVDDVILAQGPVERMFGVGTIEVQSTDTTTPTFMLQGIEDARKVATLIDDARRKERRKRGLHIETV